MRILIAGDYCARNRVADLFDKDDYASVLGDAQRVIQGVDYSIVNLECPVTKGEKATESKYGPHLHCSIRGVEALKWTGFKWVTLANNHFYDFGMNGVVNTLEVCKEYDLDVVGGGRNIYDASQILYKQIHHKTLAIINCCEHEFSIATETTGGSNPLNPIQQYYAIKEARKLADYVLIIVHGGHENYQLPSPRMQETYRFFIDSGADVVINHHQHCYSGYEIYKNRPIFYGLGNFCSDSKYKKSKKWHEGYMVIINFDINISFEIIPYNQCSEQARVRLLETTSFNEELDRINVIINDPSKLKNAVNSFYASCSKRYSDVIEPINNRFYLACKAHGWLPSLISNKRKLMVYNYIRCESHRDILIYYLS